MSKLQSKTKCDQIVEEIVSKILKGEYKENEVLQPEGYFVEYFGVGRGTVREAFKKLNTLGLVTIQQGKGTIVNRPSVGSLMQPLYSAIVFSDYNARQIYDARIILEEGVASLAAKNTTEKDAEMLRDLVSQMDAASMKRDSITFSKLDISFHGYIVKMADNEVLEIIYHTIDDVIKKYIEGINLSLEVVESSAASHHLICDAIIARDPENAMKAMRNHIEYVKNYTINQIAEGKFPVGIN